MTNIDDPLARIADQLSHAGTLAEYDAKIAAAEDAREDKQREYDACLAQLEETRERMSTIKNFIYLYDNLILKAQKNREDAAAGQVTPYDYDRAYELIAGGADPQEVRKVFQKRFPGVSNGAFRVAMWRRRDKEALREND